MTRPNEIVMGKSATEQIPRENKWQMFNSFLVYTVAMLIHISKPHPICSLQVINSGSQRKFQRQNNAYNTALSNTSCTHNKSAAAGRASHRCFSIRPRLVRSHIIQSALHVRIQLIRGLAIVGPTVNDIITSPSNSISGRSLDFGAKVRHWGRASSNAFGGTVSRLASC